MGSLNTATKQFGKRAQQEGLTSRKCGAPASVTMGPRAEVCPYGLCHLGVTWPRCGQPASVALGHYGSFPSHQGKATLKRILARPPPSLSSSLHRHLHLQSSLK
ncbi:hypothetical protein L0F63_003619 [Massospora cicadina]|nr:hypothetical protein L0F63_003619 [Massospora cicadina]